LIAGRTDIEELFDPVGVALVGPADRTGDPGRVLGALRGRWGERFSIVDPAGGKIGEVPVYERVADVPDPVDLAVLTVPAGEVLAAVEACGERGVRYVIVSASGFAELGVAGAELEERVVAAAHRNGMRVLGPNANANCFDRMDPPVHPRIGKIGLITQSGHMGRVIFQSSAHGVAFSRWVPTGNEADLDAADFIEYFAYDDETVVIAAYLEGIRDDAKFRRALEAAVARDTPVVVIKVGRHDAASRMAASHTAHLSGSDAIIDGLFKQHAVIRVGDVDELIETSALHAKLHPRPSGGRVGLYGISGGALALMADHAQSEGVEVPVLAEATQRRLHELLPAYLGVSNPVDNGNLYRTGSLQQRREILRVIAADPSVDVLVCALTGLLPGITDDYAGDILDFVAGSKTPVVVTWNTWAMDSPAYTALVESGIPIFRSFRGCFRALAGYFDYQQRSVAARARATYSAPSFSPPGKCRPAQVAEAEALLSRYGIRFVGEQRVSSASEAAEVAAALGPPVVLKALLPEYPHKSDFGLVHTGVDSPAAAGAAFETLLERSRELVPASAAPEIVVQQQVSAGTEMIIGVTSDPVFGRALAIGVGGVLTEAIRDVSVRPLPVSAGDLDEMLRELRAYPLLEGVRGRSAVDIDALVATARAVAEMAGDAANRVVELDLNPVIVGPEGAVVVDYLLMLEA
jgi:acetate---CoA ligase (ADP-forming)